MDMPHVYVIHPYSLWRNCASFSQSLSHIVSGLIWKKLPSLRSKSSPISWRHAMLHFGRMLWNFIKSLRAICGFRYHSDTQTLFLRKFSRNCYLIQLSSFINWNHLCWILEVNKTNQINPVKIKYLTDGDIFTKCQGNLSHPTMTLS